MANVCVFGNLSRVKTHKKLISQITDTYSYGLHNRPLGQGANLDV